MRVWLTARYEEGTVRVSVMAAEEYGEHGRTATAGWDLPADSPLLAAVQKALDKVLAEHGRHAERAARRAAATMLVASADEEA